jgi:cyclic pyranopterin phosphate synthase
MINEFCPRPFLEMSFQHNGDVLPCCLLDDYVLGNIKDKSIAELWNGEKIQNLRKEFLDNNIQTCKKNIKYKSCHLYYQSFLKEVERDLNQVRPPKKLDLRLNGKCNIECIMCDIWSGPNGVYDESQFWKDGEKDIFPYIEHIDLLGGEPFVQKDTFRLIDMVSKLNPNCLWAITTNGNWNFNEGIKKALDKIKLSSITISFDGIFADTYLKIRKKGNYKQTIKAIDELISYRDNGEHFHLQLDFCVQRDNFKEVFAFIHFCKKKNVAHSFIFLLDPHELSLLNMKKEDLKDFYNELRTMYTKTKDKELLTLIKPLNEHYK